MSERETGTDSSVNRRNVLRMTGAAAVGAGVFAGTASAGHEDTVVFCGCSQVCVCDIPCTSGTVIVEGGPNRPINANECVEVGPGEKIVAFDAGQGTNQESFPRVICNPNRCAQNSSFDFSRCSGPSGTFGQSGGPCGEAYLRKQCGN